MYSLLLTRKGAGADIPREISDSRASPETAATAEATELPRSRHFKSVGELLCRRKEGVKLFFAATHEARTADPLYSRSITPRLHEAISAPQGPINRRANDAARNRRRRSESTTSFLNMGQLASNYLRFAIAGEVAGAWSNAGGITSSLTNVAHLIEMIQARDTTDRTRRLRARQRNAVI